MMSLKYYGHKIRANIYGMLIWTKPGDKQFHWVITFHPYDNFKKWISLLTLSYMGANSSVERLRNSYKGTASKPQS